MTTLWGLLAKSMVDNETIEEAIARLIAVHEADETSHLGTGESLQSHKASEIIDHVASSIIEDKINDDEISRLKIKKDAVLLAGGDYDKGLVNDFYDWTSAVTLSGSITKRHRLSRVQTGATQNSVAEIYAEFDQMGNYMDPSTDLEISFNYYIGENWNSGVQHGAEIYIKYGTGHTPDMGGAGEKVFGIKIEDQANELFKVTGFVNDGTTLFSEVLATDLQATERYTFTIKKVGSNFAFFINGVEKQDITNGIIGTIGTPLFTHVAKNPVANSEADGMLSQISYYFPY